MTNREEIIDKLTRRLMALVTSKFGLSRDDSQDVVQETMLILCGPRYRHVEDESDLVPLAMQVAKYKGLEFIYGRRKYGDLPENFDVVDPNAGSDRKVLADDDAKRANEWLVWLRNSVSKMDEGCRRLFQFRLAGRSTAEIAQELGKTPNHVGVMEHRCRQKMRDMLPEGAQR